MRTEAQKSLIDQPFAKSHVWTVVIYKGLIQDGKHLISGEDWLEGQVTTLDRANETETGPGQWERVPAWTTKALASEAAESMAATHGSSAAAMGMVVVSLTAMLNSGDMDPFPPFTCGPTEAIYGPGKQGPGTGKFLGYTSPKAAYTLADIYAWIE